jgi:hypothetical protein
VLAVVGQKIANLTAAEGKQFALIARNQDASSRYRVSVNSASSMWNTKQQNPTHSLDKGIR